MSLIIEDIRSRIANADSDQKIAHVLHLADNSLIMGHRLSEWTGHGPMLEQDIAISNIALDLIGQSRNFYQYAAEQSGNGITEDMLAYFRDAHEFRNFILVELPNGDWGKTIMKVFLFSAYQSLLYQKMLHSEDTHLAGIAEKSLKEVTYHLRWSSEWVIRLGDGTEISKQKITKALNETFSYTEEFFRDQQDLKPEWNNQVQKVFTRATLDFPHTNSVTSENRMQMHTEHLTELLTVMQTIQRAHPGCEW